MRICSFNVFPHMQARFVWIQLPLSMIRSYAGRQRWTRSQAQIRTFYWHISILNEFKFSLGRRQRILWLFRYELVFFFPEFIQEVSLNQIVRQLKALYEHAVENCILMRIRLPCPPGIYRRTTDWSIPILCAKSQTGDAKEKSLCRRAAPPRSLIRWSR